MDNKYFLIYLSIMVLTTYLIRALPFALVKEKINNRFLKSFFYYIPYAALTAMTIPAVFSCTKSVLSASIAVAVAIILAIRKQSLTTVAVAACVAVYIVELFL